jgi:hypothetical protein
MRRSPLALVAGAAFLAACSDSPTTPTKAIPLGGPSRTLGNGFPEGGHDYRLNIIGVPKNKSAAMDDNNGRRIFVQLESSNTVTSPGGKNNQLAFSKVNHIYLCNSTNGENDYSDPKCNTYWQTNYNQFGVLDANATDQNGAILALPDPCADADPTTACTPGYKIYARAHGTPGGNATITTCADETGIGFDGTDDIWCGSNGINLAAKGGQKAIEITDNLLRMTITVDETTDPGLAACLGDNQLGAEVETVYLFDNCLENYFWNYDNNGLKLLELRFYNSH